MQESLNNEENQLKEAKEKAQLEHENLLDQIKDLKEKINKAELEEAELEAEETILRDREIEAELQSEELWAKEEMFKKEEEILKKQEETLRKRMQEAEQKELGLRMRREFEGELEMRLQGLLMSEDIWHRKNWDELRLIEDCMEKLDESSGKSQLTRKGRK